MDIEICHTIPYNENLRIEIHAMREIDQAARLLVVEYHERNGWDKPLPSDIYDLNVNIDKENNPKLKFIIETYGWPGYSIVGKEGSNDFWLLVQHQDRDLDFQKECLRLLARAVEENDASPENLAYLTDRVRKNEGKPQLYATQWTQSENGKLKLYPVEDIEHLDERLQSMGMPSLEDYKRMMMQGLNLTEEDFEG